MTRLANLLFQKFIGSRSEKPTQEGDLAEKLYVEFIGPAGVGKSTVFKALMKDSRSLIKLDDYRRNGNIQPAKINTEFDEIYHNLISHKLDQVYQNNFSPLDKIQVLAYFHRVVEGDRIVMLHDRRNVVISDEGLLHNFRQGMEHEILHGRIPSSFLANRMVINCHSTPERIAEQILKRHRDNGTILPQHKNKTVRQLALDLNLVCQQILTYKKILIQTGLPVLDIDTSANTDLNVKHIMEFISVPREGTMNSSSSNAH